MPESSKRQRTEDALHEREMMLKDLINANPQSFALITSDGVVLMANEIIARRINMTATQLIGRCIFDFLPPKVAQIRRERAAEAVRTGRQIHWEDERDGCWLDNYYQPVMDADGEITKLAILGIDITERKMASQAVSLLASIVEGAEDGIYSKNLDAIVTTWNDAAQRLYGYSAAEMIGRNIALLMPPDRVGEEEEIIEKIKRNERIKHLETFRRHKDGHLLDVSLSISPIKDVFGQVVGASIISRDISEHKRIEERFRAIADYTVDWESWVNPVGKLVWLNPAVEQMTGYSREECLQMPDYPLPIILETHLESLQSWLISFKSETRGSNLEFQIKRKDKALRWASVSWQPIYNVQGEFLGIRSSVRDITDYKMLADEFYQAQKMESIGQLAGGIAHDFNNILAATTMQLNLLQANPNLTKETLATLEDLEKGLQQASDLTRQLLMFSRKSLLDMQVINLDEVIENLLKMLRRLIGENIKLLFESGKSLPFIIADSGMMGQVLMNLVVNARDAMPRGGRITISTDAVVITKDQLKENPNRQTGRFVRMTVSDDGCGIHEDTLNRIFEPFFTTKEPGKGTGLGLATVFGIVAQHKGWIEVISKIGRGSQFQVFLPVTTKPPLPAKITVQQPSVASPGNETVLLVEDDRIVRQSVSQVLRLLNYRVYEACNGQEAMVIWQEHASEVDLLFTDLIMPEGITGMELAERLREAKPRLKVIISSGYSAELTQLATITPKGILYLPKPYPASLLGGIVRKCFDQQ